MRILGRKDNLFISGGENIQPEEIEEELLSLAGITHAVVVPLPDDEFGERPAAFIHDTTQTYTLAAICAHLEKKLPRFKLPIKLFPLPPEHQTSKPSRSQLRHLASDM